jgi:transposase-like protein
MIAARHGVSTSQVYRWMRQHRQLDAPPMDGSALLPVKLIPSGARVRRQAAGERAGSLHLDVGAARLHVEGAADLPALRLMLDYLLA